MSATEALDPDFALEWAAQELARGNADQWTVCNCFSYAKVMTKNSELISGIPNVGGVAVFKYKGVEHRAYIKSITGEGFTVTEANYVPCLVAGRFVPWTDPHIIGFLVPKDSS